MQIKILKVLIGTIQCYKDGLTHDGKEHRVLDDYERNVTLVDLTKQPKEIKSYVDDTIDKHLIAKNPSMVGAHFMKFCGKWDMQRIVHKMLHNLSNYYRRIILEKKMQYVAKSY